MQHGVAELKALRTNVFVDDERGVGLHGALDLRVRVLEVLDVVQDHVRDDDVVRVLFERVAIEVEHAIAHVRRRIFARAFDVVTFTSASTVDNFFAKMSDTHGALLASIGPVTSEALGKHGRKADVEASAATIDALRDAIVDHVRRR